MVIASLQALRVSTQDGCAVVTYGLAVLFHLGSPRVSALQEYLGDVLCCSSVGWEQRGCVASTVGR